MSMPHYANLYESINNGTVYTDPTYIGLPQKIREIYLEKLADK
jgi:hypothetical protein